MSMPTYENRHRGLDHDWFDHSVMHRRSPIAWPDRKALALWITVPVEFFPLSGPAQPFRPIGALDRPYPDYWGYSNRDYGTRIGIYRIMRVLDDLGLRATAAVNAEVARRFPRVLDEILKRKWEVMAHGLDMGHLHHGGLTVEVESEMVARATDVLRTVAGDAVRGWHSPGHGQSKHTLQLLAQHGYRYVADWANDDLPYMMRTASGPICAMPLTYEWSDRLLMVQQSLSVEDYENQVLRACRRLKDEAERQGAGRILSLSVSPWVMGYPHRIETLRRVLDTILSEGSVWPATGIEIVGRAAPAD